jgi:hypothetical protein
MYVDQSASVEMCEWDGKRGMYTLTNGDVWTCGLINCQVNDDIDHRIGAGLLNSQISTMNVYLLMLHSVVGQCSDLCVLEVFGGTLNG